MRTLLLILLVLSPLASCNEPSSPDPDVALAQRALEMYAAWGGKQRLPRVAAPNCNNAGPPTCRPSGVTGVDLCRDVCGGEFAVLGDTGACVNMETGDVYTCDGFAQ